MEKRTKIIILIFLIIFIFGYVKLGKFIDDKLTSFWYKSDIKGFAGYDKEGLQHFPKELPKSATNIKYQEDVGRKSISFYLIMKNDKDWILRQINSYSYSEIESPDNYSNFYYGNISDFIQRSGFTYYIIYKNKYPYPSYYYGLATDKDYTQIIYYYVNSRH